MNKRITTPAPVSPLAFPRRYEYRFSRFVVRPTPDGQHVIMDTLFGLQVGKAYTTVDDAEQAAQQWRDRAEYAEYKAVA